MDFGATICKPQLPLCTTCVLNAQCKAFLLNQVDQLPVKEKSISKKIRWFYYIVAEYRGQVLVRKRGPKDIWENLYEFVLIERSKAASPDQLMKDDGWQCLMPGHAFTDLQCSAVYRQLLTHQTIYGQFIRVKLQQKPSLQGFELVDQAALNLLPFPKFITNYLKDKTVSLNLF